MNILIEMTEESCFSRAVKTKRNKHEKSMTKPKIVGGIATAAVILRFNNDPNDIYDVSLKSNVFPFSIF